MQLISRGTNPAKFRREEQQIIPDMQEPIISEEEFERVQELRSHKRRNTKTGRQSLFAGLLYCPDCGAKLHFCAAKRLKPNQEFYRCANYNSGRRTCKIHYIRNVVLEKIFWKRSAVWRIMCAATSRCFCISSLCRITRSIK